MNIKKDILWRVYLAFFLVILMATLVGYKIIKIQTYQDHYWAKMADSLTTAYVSIDPVRGNIYADDGRLLATSLPIYEIRLDLNTPSLTDNIFYNNIDSLAIRLSAYFRDRSAYQYKRLLTRRRKEGARYFLLKRNINHNQLKKIKKFPIFRRGRYKGGFIAEQKSKRILPFGQLARRTIGYKVDHVAGVGLEGAYNKYLSGKSGKRLLQKVAGGQWIPINDKYELEPENGKDIVTTIDINIQDVAENALLKALKEHKAKHGCAVVMEVGTGKVKAIANLERNKNGTYTENYNFAVGESLEPGSTFKLASAMILLENGLIHPDDTINTGKGKIKYFENTPPIRDAKKGGYGTITFKRALEVSSNVAFSKLVFSNYSNGPGAFIDELKDLKLQRPLGLPIAGEGKPVIKEPGDRSFSGITLPWMAMGYEVRLTPLQLLTLYNAVANNGKMMKPILVTEISKVGKTIRKFSPQVRSKRLCSERTCRELKKMLAGVVNKGTAKNLSRSVPRIAGKTGTAQIATEKGYQQDNDDYLASFVGFFPVKKPQYSCIVWIHSPSNGVYYGAYVAGPVFREISKKIYSQSLKMGHQVATKKKAPETKLPPHSTGHINDLKTTFHYLDIPFHENKKVIDWVYAQQIDSALLLKNKKLEPNTIPDVRGLGLGDAIYLLENRGLKVEARGEGKVITQSLPPGTPAGNHKKILLKMN